ncbi:MAG: ATP-dependent RecD-like DNA helicase [Oscillospiraceae bacterium]|nr:ATP-dependent RecD-like DNA helicase [Oscillospiraceae bacterium]
MEQQELLQITGTVEDIIYRNEENGYTVVDIEVKKEMITATGIMPTVESGMEVRLFGYYKSHPSYGLQFAVETFEQTIPTSIQGILRYLSSGAIKGVGFATANNLVKAFRENTLTVMENEPERVAKIRGISMTKAVEISNQLKENLGIRELMLYLSEFSISAHSAVKIYRIYGDKSLEYIRENPYQLCNSGLRVSFEMADMIAKKQERPIDEMCRIRAGIVHVLNHNILNGHTCLPKDRLISTTSDFLQVDNSLTEKALENMVFDRSVMMENFQDREFIFLPELHRAESFIAARIKMMMSFPAAKFENTATLIENIEKEDNIIYADKQKEAIAAAMEKGFLILTGGPGTGKTTTLNAIIKLLEQNGQKVLLAAPTGRASQRMGELTGKEAKTIHRLLEVAYDSEGKLIFKRNEKNLLKCDTLIVDEVSMVDSQLFASLIEALAFGTRLILVGDSNQLPSVGPGNVLGSLISSKVLPYVELTEIFRQSMESLIVTNAHKIVEGELPEISCHTSDFFFLPTNNSADTVSLVVDLYTRRLVNSYGYTPAKDIQILCPGRKGPLGSNELNDRLQSELNPPEKDKPEIKFGSKVLRIGDKVMQNRNNYDILFTRDNGEVGAGIFNGDIGEIVEINKKQQSIKIKFDDKTAMYDYDASQDIELSYATTIHKSQGNEFEAVIIPLFNTPPQLCYRNLLYTGVTRAKKLLILAGDKNIISAMAKSNKRNGRYSGLKDFLLRDDII